MLGFFRGVCTTQNYSSIIFSFRIRYFNLEPRISQQMLTYNQISVFVEKGDESQVKSLTLTAVKLHLTRKSAVLLQ